MIQLTQPQFDQLLSTLIERDDRLLHRDQTTPEPDDQAVDLYAFSAHVEALSSLEIDGEIWETLADLELDSGDVADESQAWEKIKGFYLERDCLLLTVGDDEFIVSRPLAQFLGLLS